MKMGFGISVQCPSRLDVAIFYNSRGLEGHRAACNRMNGGLIVVRVSEARAESHYQRSESTFL